MSYLSCFFCWDSAICFSHDYFCTIWCSLLFSNLISSLGFPRYARMVMGDLYIGFVMFSQIAPFSNCCALYTRCGNIISFSRNFIKPNEWIEKSLFVFLLCRHTLSFVLLSLKIKSGRWSLILHTLSNPIFGVCQYSWRYVDNFFSNDGFQIL